MLKRVCQNGTAIRSDRSNRSGPNIPVGPNRTGPFHLTFDLNYRNFWYNESTVDFSAGKDSHPLMFFVCLFFMVRERRRQVSSNPVSNQTSFHLLERVHPLRLEGSHITPARLLLA